MRKRAGVAFFAVICIMAPPVGPAEQPFDRAGTSALTFFGEEVDRMPQVHHAQPISYTHTLRVTFVVEDSNIHIASVTRVAMRVPAASTPAPQEGQVGSWFEIRDGKGALLYHRPLHDPMRLDVETFGDKPGDPLRHVPARHANGEFEVLIPDLPDAEQIRLYGPRASQEKGLSRSAVLAEHRFDDLRKMAQQTQGGRPQTQGGVP